MELRFQQRSVLSQRPHPFRSITLVIESPPRPLNDYPWATELHEAARSKQTPLGPLYSFLKASSHPINFKIHRHTHSHTYIIKLKRKTDAKEQTNYLLIVNWPGLSEDMVCDIHSGSACPGRNSVKPTFFWLPLESGGRRVLTLGQSGLERQRASDH